MTDFCSILLDESREALMASCAISNEGEFQMGKALDLAAVVNQSMSNEDCMKRSYKL